jgi:hypothetical protein
MIKGITVTLYTKAKTGVDAFNKPVYEETPVEVENVLVEPISSEDVTYILNLTGKKAVYEMAIPKGDTHDWKDKRVDFFNQKFRTFGEPISGIDSNIPLSWNTKVKVEIYE